MRREKLIKAFKTLLILASILATVKLWFVDYTLDEEYQIVMSYRSLSGDRLFGTMWEPHQTSAFVCTLLMWIFEKFTGGTTGVVLFLRLVTTGIQLLLAEWLVRALRRVMDREYAFLIGCCYFNMVPKIIQIPEFSNLQLWFYTILVLALIEYYGTNFQEPDARTASKWLLVLAGIAMSGEVLAYPSCVILFPLFALFLVRRSGWRDTLIFTGTCGGCALVWLGMVLSQTPWSEFVRNIPIMLSFDRTHGVGWDAEQKTAALARGLGGLLLPALAGILLGLLLYGGLRFLGRKRAQTGATVPQGDCYFLIVCCILAAEVVQFFYWIILQRGYEEPQVYLLFLFAGAFAVWKQADGRKYILLPGILGGALTIPAVIYMSDMDAWYAIPHGLLGALLGAALLTITVGAKQKEKGRTLNYVLLFSLAFCIVFGKGFTLRAGNTDTNSVLGIRGVIRRGPAAGIFTNYMQSYIMNCTYEDFEQYVEDGENCLIVTNMVGTAGTTPYLFGNYGVSHFSVIDPTSYDEKLLTYWELYPEKYPDVIVVDCWYGGLQEREDSWIMRYIEDEYGYTSVEDGRYVRFYRRNH